MVTYRLRRSELLGRIKPPHPALVLLLVLAAALLVSVVYAEEPEPLPADDDLEKMQGVEPRAVYEAAGIRFNASGSSFTTIGGFSTSNMTWAGNGGMVLYQAFSNIDAAIDAVEAKAVTVTDLDSVFYKYLGQGGLLNNIWDLVSAISSNLTSFDSRVTTALKTVNASLSSVDGALSDFLGGSFVVTLDSNQPVSVTGFDSFLESSQRNLMLSLSSGGLYLGASGTVTRRDPPWGIVNFVRYGLLGLSVNLAGDDKVATFSLLSPSDSEDGGLEAEEVQVNNLLDALGLIGTHLQNPLAKLQYVLANDDDIALKDAVQENQDSFQDNFTGSGSGSVSGSQIKDMAGISSSAGNAFKDDASAADAFTAISDSKSYGFFSQEVADALDTVNSSAAAALDEDDFMDGFVLGEDGFYHVADSSPWDVSAFLGGAK